jgi:membrane fusion protein, multidrug efflux system
MAVLAMLAAAGGCGKKPAPPERPAALVAAADVNVCDVPVYLDEIGSCTAIETVSVRPQVTGQLAEVHFVDGAELKKGDKLFTIDDRPFKAALAQAQASLAQNRATLELATEQFDRAKRLLPSSAISQEEYQTRQTAYNFAVALVRNGEAAVETAQVNLNYCYIHSPIDGRASLNQVDAGNVVSSVGGAAGAGATMVVINTMDPIYVDFTITERDLAAVRRQMAGGPLKVQVRMPDEPQGKAREGELTFVDNAVQQSTGTVNLRATLANGDRHFWPGQFVRVRLVLSVLKDAALVEDSAVQISQAGPYVYVVRDDMTAELRLVKKGQRQDGMVVISEGVKAGEKVVTSGQLGVTPDGKGRIQEATKPAAATNGGYGPGKGKQ